MALRDADDSQDAAIQRSLALTPADRLAQLEAAVEFLAEARTNAAAADG